MLQSKPGGALAQEAVECIAAIREQPRFAPFADVSEDVLRSISSVGEESCDDIFFDVAASDLIDTKSIGTCGQRPPADPSCRCRLPHR